MIIDELADLNVSFVSNDCYETTNGIYSAWLAKSIFVQDDDVLLLSADVFFGSDVLQKLISCKKDPVLLTDTSRIATADFRFGFTKDFVLFAYGKDLPNNKTDGECVGAGKLSSSFAQEWYYPHLCSMIDKNIKNLWWESVLYDLIGIKNVYVEDINGLFWGEVDTLEDYKRLLAFYEKK